MINLPVNIVNLICSYASHDKPWYPHFCPNTHKLSWKINKNYKKHIENGMKIFHHFTYTFKSDISNNVDVVKTKCSKKSIQIHVLDDNNIDLQIYEGTILDYGLLSSFHDVFNYEYNSFYYLEFNDIDDSNLVFRTYLPTKYIPLREYYEGYEATLYLNGTVYGKITGANWLGQREAFWLCIEKY